MVRQTEINDNIVFKYGDFIINTRCYTVTLNGEKIELSYKEFTILLLLVRHPGWVFSKEEIYEFVYGDEISIDIDNKIFCLIYSLRKKLELDPHHPKYIKTVRGVGYKLEYN